jgi:dihydropteroate synthase
MLSTVADLGCGYVMSHLRGDPRTMNSLATYSTHGHGAEQRLPRHLASAPSSGVVQAVTTFWAERYSAARTAGVRRWNVVLDPGIGFAKNARHNLELLNQLPKIRATSAVGAGCLFAPALLVGVSRKGFIRKGLEGIDGGNGDTITNERLDRGSIGACAAACMNGANIVRTHAVAELRDALTILDSVRLFRHDEQSLKK